MERGGREPLNPHIADGEAIVGCIVILPGAHGRPGAVDEEMVDQMALAEGWELVTVQKAMQPIAGKFRDHDRGHQSRDDSNEGDVKSFVDHRCSSIQFLPTAPKTIS